MQTEKNTININDPEKLDNLVDLSFLTYDSGEIDNPYSYNPILNTKNVNKIVFADDTASGRPCRLVDEFIIKEIYPYYSNTHSNATCGILMKNLVEKTRSIIRTTMNLSDHHKIFFSGNGCTGAFNHLVNKIDFTKHRKIFIHNTPFEHHSNFLPWREKINDLSRLGFLKDRQIQQRLIGTDQNSPSAQTEIKLDIASYVTMLKNELNTENDISSRLDILSLTACSNVTGERFDMEYTKLWEFILEYRSRGHQIYLILDCACIAPYIKIDLKKCDGVCFSGHKFLGGQCTPGVLIVDEKLIEVDHPYEPGGGCVEKADDKCTVYKADPEVREMGGTPNIIGIIRLGKVLMIKDAILDIIEHNERLIETYITTKMKMLEKKYDTFRVVNMNNRTKDNLPIYPITIEDLHYNFITVLLNDLFGVQTRGGISCCGTLGRICKETLHVNGWCRVTFSYLHTAKEIDYIINAIEYVVINGKNYEKYYDYDSKKNLFSLKLKR